MNVCAMLVKGATWTPLPSGPEPSGGQSSAQQVWLGSAQPSKGFKKEPCNQACIPACNECAKLYIDSRVVDASNFGWQVSFIDRKAFIRRRPMHREAFAAGAS